MNTFNAGAWRPVKGQSRAAQLASANDLVTRTLAQHGLTAAPVSGLPAGAASDALSGTLSGLMARLQPQGQTGSASTFPMARSSRTRASPATWGRAAIAPTCPPRHGKGSRASW